MGVAITGYTEARMAKNGIASIYISMTRKAICISCLVSREHPGR